MRNSRVAVYFSERSEGNNNGNEGMMHPSSLEVRKGQRLFRPETRTMLYSRVKSIQDEHNFPKLPAVPVSGRLKRVTRNKYLRKSVKFSVFFPCFANFPYFVLP